MPAVTPPDVLALPVLDPPSGDVAFRPVRSVSTAPSGFEGEGFPVRRAFAGVPVDALDPFIHMDQMGEVQYAPGEPKGTPWHPHRGFETVTYMIDGTFRHQDSIGGGGLIANGATQWMTAGSGILHIERPPDELIASGGLFHGIQLWVNLPAADKFVPPRYQNIEPDVVTLLASPDGGALVRLIAGSLDGHAGPGSTHTPISLLHLTVAPGARVAIPTDPTFNCLLYVLAGHGSVGGGPGGSGSGGGEPASIESGQLAVMGPGGAVAIGARPTQDSRTDALEVLLLSGRPIKEPVAAYGPFVMNTRQELAQAFEDFEAGRLGTIPADHIGD